MNNFLKSVFIYIFWLTSVNVNGQHFEPKGVIAVDISIPTNERNVAFERTMEGLFHGGIGYQHSVWKGFAVGAGVNYSFFKANQFSLKQTIGRGGLHLPGVHLKLGYEKFTTDRFSFYGGVRGGLASAIVVNDSCKLNTGKSFQALSPFLELQFEITVLTEQNSPDGFNINLGYSFYFNEYNASYLCRHQLPGIIDEDTNGILRFLSFGFGYRFYFQK